MTGCASAGPEARTTEPLYVFEPPSESELAAIKHPMIREALLDMMERDQRARRSSRLADDENALRILTEIDRKNTAQMHQIVGENGWPTISAVGSDGAKAAWLLVQHADLDVGFQRQCLQLMEAELGRGEVYPANVAYLTDRVLVNEGKKQEYGTQFYSVNGTWEPRPIRNVRHVDKRRKRMGLSTLEEYRELMKA